MELFLRHCYSCLDLTPVADADIMRLIMLADEFEAKQLLAECDEAIAARQASTPYKSAFIEKHASLFRYLSVRLRALVYALGKNRSTRTRIPQGARSYLSRKLASTC